MSAKNINSALMYIYMMIMNHCRSISGLLIECNAHKEYNRVSRDLHCEFFGIQEYLAQNVVINYPQAERVSIHCNERFRFLASLCRFTSYALSFFFANECSCLKKTNIY